MLENRDPSSKRAPSRPLRMEKISWIDQGNLRGRWTNNERVIDLVFFKVKYLLLNFKTRMEREKRMMECLIFTYSEAILNVEARGWLVSTAGAWRGTWSPMKLVSCWNVVELPLSSSRDRERWNIWSGGWRTTVLQRQRPVLTRDSAGNECETFDSFP